MVLANMIKTDEDALICVLAEYYNIYDYRSVPVQLVATLSVGLRDDSRIKMLLSKKNVSFERLMLAGIYDGIKMLVWSKTKDAAKNINHPESIVSVLVNGVKTSDIERFESGEDFLRERNKILQGGR